MNRTSESAPAVAVENLERRFNGFVAVDRISFEIRPGEVFGFIGPNGAGKSTTIRMLCGILPPTGGTGTVAGYRLGTETERIKSSIGYMSQKFSLYDDLSVEENLNFFSGLYNIPSERSKERKEWVLEMADLKDQRQVRTSLLPGGWKQRLALGCAFLHEPPILFLDEPTSGVDPITRRRFWDLIYDFSDRGVTVFVTTHYMDEAEYCDRLGLIYRGKLAALGTPQELKTRYMPGAVLEVACERPIDAMRHLENREGILGLEMFGNRLHVVTDQPGAWAERLQTLLTEGGFPVAGITPVVPTLENVFVSLIESFDREHPETRERES